MPCPDCGYMMSAFDKECPRCKVNPPKTRPQVPPAMPPEPVASTAAPQLTAATQLHVSPAASVSRSTSPLSIAAGVICGILFVIGLLLIVIGGIAYSHRKDAIYNLNTKLSVIDLEGGYVPPVEADGERKVADIESEGDTEQSIKIIVAGIFFCLPMIPLVATNARRRKR